MTRCLWWAEFEAAVWPVTVVVGDVGSQDGFEMASPEDEDPVEAFASDGADPASASALAWGARMGVRIAVMCSARKTSSKARVNLVSRSRIRKRRPARGSAAPIERLRAGWVTQTPVGCAVAPARWNRWVSSSMKNRT